MLPAQLQPSLEEHLKRLKFIHERDLQQGYGEAYLPFALLKKAKRYKAIGGKRKTLLKSDVLMSYEP
jgi:hypothetical protein